MDNHEEDFASWDFGPAISAFERLIDQHGFNENQQIEMMTSFFRSGIVEVGLLWLNEYPEELEDFLLFVENDFLPRQARLPNR